jgi:hypothetical protein
MLSLNCKNVQHVKTYLPCNFEVNPITHFDRCLYSSNLGTFWLKIEQFWPFEEISIFSNGGHLGYRTALTDTICISTMMSFLAYITGFFMNCEILPILTDYANKKKGGMKLKKLSSPLKLLSQFQPNFAEMILRWSPFKIVSVSAVLYPRWPPLRSNLGTFWLKIEQFWPFEEIYIFSNGGHLGYRTALTDTILKGDHLRIISNFSQTLLK